MSDYTYLPSIHQAEYSGLYTGPFFGKKGFKQFFDINNTEYINNYISDNKIKMSFTYNKDFDNLDAIDQLCRIFLPPGCIQCYISLTTWQNSTEYGRVAWNKDPELSTYVSTKVYKTTGYTLPEIIKEEYFCFFQDGGGTLTPSGKTNFSELTTGGWLCFKTSAAVKQIILTVEFNYNNFKTWYNSAVWDTNGDPKTSITETSLKITPETISLSKDPGTFIIYIESDTTWTLTSDSWWLTTDFTNSGKNNEKKGFSCAENSGTVSRTGKITVKTLKETKYITINQSVASTSLSVSKETVNITKDAGTFSILVTCDNNWGVYSDSSWITITSENSGFNSGTVTCSYPQNSGTSRTNTIKIYTGTKTKTINIIQAGTGTSSLSIFPESVSLNKDSGTFFINIISSIKWTATSDSSWISIVSGSSGTSNGIIYCTNLQSLESTDRIGKIKVNNTNEEKTATIIQSSTSVINLSVYPETISLNKNSGTFSLSITSNTNWTATSNVSWITITSGSSGSKSGTINCTNTQSLDKLRSGYIKVSTSTETVLIVINQTTDTQLQVSPQIISLSKDPGTFLASITSNADWTVSSDSSWLTIDFDNTGKGNELKGFSCTENLATTSRVGNIEVKTLNETKKIIVTQTTSITSLSVSSETVSIPKTSGTFTISVTCNNNWGVYTDSSWITITSGNSGFNSGTITCTYLQNSDISRTNTIKIFAGTQAKTINITQAGTGTSNLTVFPDNISLNKESNIFNLSVMSSTSWSVRNISTWLSIISGNSGSNDGTITCVSSENIGTVDRSDIITISNSGASRTVNIVQTYITTPTLSVNPINVSLLKNSGIFSISVVCNTTWKSSSDSSWLTITSGTSGNNNGTIKCSYLANSLTTVRNGCITIISSSETLYTQITQSASSVTTTDLKDFDIIIKTKKEYEDDYGEQIKEKIIATQQVIDGVNIIKTQSPINFKDLFESEKSFGYISYVSGDYDKILKEKYAYDIKKVLQKGYFNIGNINNVTVITSEKPNLSTSLSKSKLDKDAGTFTVSVKNTGKGTMVWVSKVDSSSSWITITSGSSGSNAGTINCSYTANKDEVSRTGKIIVTSSGASGSPKTVSVSQNKNIVIVTPGTVFSSGYQSYHQIERKINYCSDKTTNDPAGIIICNKLNQSMYYTTMKGFKNLFNIDDPKIGCYGQTSCTLNDDDTIRLSTSLNDTQMSSTFRVYVPRGSVSCIVSIYGMTSNGAIATIAQFGTPPVYNQATIKSYDDDIPNNINGFTVPEYKEGAQFVKNNGGTIQVTKLQEFPMITEGGWLYIAILSFDGSSTDTYKHTISVKVGEYRKAYKKIIWGSDGDPLEYK